MKKIYELMLFQEIPAEEFYSIIMENFVLKDSCYSCKSCTK